MESTAQATQRKITLESLDLVRIDRPDIQIFNELLIQYPSENRRRPEQVVPDNMIVVHSEPIQATGSFDLPFQPVGPFCVLEYVSKQSKRKDYEDNFDRYEKHLRVSYYLIFYPDNQELSLYHLEGSKYVAVKPNAQGRLTLPELELEVSLLEGWVRFWFRGKLVPLPADLQRELKEATRRAEEAAQRAEKEARRAEKEAQRAEQASHQAEEALRRAEEETQRADRLSTDLERERKSREALEQEIQRLREQLDRR